MKEIDENAVTISLDVSSNTTSSDIYLPTPTLMINTPVQTKPTHAESYIYIAIGSVIGVLFRILLSLLNTEISSHESESLLGAFDSGYLLPNQFGCILMGFTFSWALHIARLHRHKTYMETLMVTFTGTGLCGSMTSFSTWNASAAMQFAYGDIADAVLRLILMYTLSYCSFHFGIHLFQLFESRSSRVTLNISPCVAKYGGSIILFILLFIPLILLIIGNIIDNYITLSIILGPVGALLRSYLSRKLNSLDLFYGTFLSNIAACTIYGFMSSLCELENESTGNAVCSYGYRSVMIGFCGSLSTVSTFIKEVHVLLNRRTEGIFASYRYVLVSIIAAQILLVIIFFMFHLHSDMKM